MFWIILLGCLLRLSFIDKPEGLWNDEYVSWYVANTPLFKEFFSAIFKQCHMPLYYIYLKPFTSFSDTVLRLTSFIPSVISIFIMYLVGKEYSKKAAYFTLLITSILSFLVYYSQEVRFYSLLFMFSAANLLFTIRYLQSNSKKDLAGYIISNCLILSTHIIGGIYVLFSSLYIIIKKKKLKFALLLTLPIIAAVFVLKHGYLYQLQTAQWWGHFSYTNILFLFSDYFSPILSNNVNAPMVFFYNKSLAVWLTVPTIIAVIGMVFGAKRGLALVAFSTILAMSVLAITGNLVFITKYSIEILPILILFLALGFEKLKKAGSILLTIFVLFHLSAFYTPHYVTKIRHSEGHKIAGDILNLQNAQNIVFTYYAPDRFSRYTDFKGKNLFYISKNNRFEYINNPERILDNIPISQTVSVVFLDSVSFLSEKYLEESNDSARIPEMFRTFSTVKNSIIKRLNDDFTDFDVKTYGSWTIIKATRLK